MKKQVIFLILASILNGLILGAVGIPTSSPLGIVILVWMSILVAGYANFLWRN